MKWKCQPWAIHNIFMTRWRRRRRWQCRWAYAPLCNNDDAGWWYIHKYVPQWEMYRFATVHIILEVVRTRLRSPSPSFSVSPYRHTEHINSHILIITCNETTMHAFAHMHHIYHTNKQYRRAQNAFVAFFAFRSALPRFPSLRPIPFLHNAFVRNDANLTFVMFAC